MEEKNKRLPVWVRIRNGEKIVCEKCGIGTYVTDAKDVSTSHCFYCDNCGVMINIDPCIDIE